MKTRRFLFPLVLASLSTAAPVHAAASFTGFYSQDFNVLGTTGTNINVTAGATPLPTGWDATASSYDADDGSTASNGIYSYGSTGSSDRALGARGSTSQHLGVAFVNNTGFSLTTLYVNFIGEQWQRGTGGVSAIDKLVFQYSTTATGLTSGTYTAVPALDFVSPNTSDVGSAVALNGNATGNFALVSGSITGLNIAPGATFWLRWSGFDKQNGTQDSLAVDDFQISTSPIPVPEPGVTSLLALLGAFCAVRRRRTV